MPPNYAEEKRWTVSASRCPMGGGLCRGLVLANVVVKDLFKFDLILGI
jgi:hypothetical protein